MKEIWKDIEGYEGRYQVSNFGNVKSLNYKHTGEEKIMQSCKDKIGYLKPFPFDNGYYFDHLHDRFRFFCNNCGKINEFDLDGFDRKLIDVLVEIHRNYD